MVDHELTLLRALLFGKGRFARSGAPEPTLLGDLAPALPGSVLGDAIQTISNIGAIGDEDRFATLAKLLAEVAERGIDELLAESVIRHPGAASYRPASLIAESVIHHPGAASYLPAPLIPRALSAVRAEPSGTGRARALIALAQLRPQEEARALLLDEALTAAHEAGKDYDAKNAFITLAAHQIGPLPDTAARKLLGVVETMNDDERSGVIHNLIPALGRLLKLEVCQTALAELPLDSPDARVRGLLHIAPHLPSRQRDESLVEALDVASKLDLKARDRTHLLSELSLRLGGDAGKKALAEAKAPYEKGIFVWPKADDVILSCYSDLTQLDDPTLAPGLRERVPALTVEQRVPLALAPYLSESQLAVAVEEIVELPWDSPFDSADTSLNKLTPYLSEALQQRIVEIANDQDRPDEVRARILSGAASGLTPSVVPKAVEVAHQITQDWWRAHALAALHHRLPDGPQRIFEPGFEPYSSIIAEIMKEQPLPVQMDVVQELIRAVWDYYGGAAPTESDEPRAPERTTSAEPPAAPQQAEPGTWGEMSSMEEPPAATQETDPETWWDEMSSMEEPPAATQETGPPPRGGVSIKRADRRSARESHEPVVNTGFATRKAPTAALRPELPLAPSRRYYFWLQVGQRLDRAIDAVPTGLPADKLPEGACLKVVLFGFKGELEVDPKSDVGELRLGSGGTASVAKPAATPRPATKDLLRMRLFFPVTMPARPGRFRLRCNIYYEQVLVQSHLVEATVAPWLQRLLSRVPQAQRKHAQQALCDYTLSNTLGAKGLRALESHRLSIMLNDNGDGTHGFRLFGSDGREDFKSDASLDGQQLQDLIDKSREAMRKAAWGKATFWDHQDYRYKGPRDMVQLRDDMVRFAKWGYRLYDALIDQLAAGQVRNRREAHEAVTRLRRLMLEPGFVQLASKQSARHVVPLALIYDYDLDTTVPSSDVTLCPAFVDAVDKSLPVIDTGCFCGACPSRDKDNVVCPSGFWGYRHRIGMPVSVGEDLPDAAFTISVSGSPELVVAVSTDPGFELRLTHEKSLKALRGVRWSHADSRGDAIRLMQAASSHIVYFYCHGGIWNGVPYIEVGDPNAKEYITRDFLRHKGIFWDDPQPLIFINGCHTAALEPEQALDLVSGFVRSSNAAGVIGTEITVFESLAVTFGEECLRHFVGGKPIGEAVRRGRIKLLEEGNPLGLVYIPFVTASLSLSSAP